MSRETEKPPTARDWADDQAQEFTRKLRAEEIPSEGYQHRGRKTWDEGIALALAALLREVREEGRRDESKAIGGSR